MNTKNKAKIFLASERGHSENEWFRSYNTFNFGAYQSQHKTPFGDLYVLNDDTLAGGKEVKFQVEENSLVFIIPVVGAVQYKNNSNNESAIQPGEVFHTVAEKGAGFKISNPYEKDLVNYIQVWIKTESVETNEPLLCLFEPAQRDALQKVCWAPTVNLYIGKYNGRSEETFAPSQPGSGLFVFILNGAFEVQNRLLESKDGLALYTIDAVEFEALSNEAILLLLEISYKLY